MLSSLLYNSSVIIGTRGSKLALVQADEVAKRIPGSSIKIIKTSADKSGLSLSKFTERGVFVKEIEERLLRGEIEIAVHSAKDLPTEIPEGLELFAITERLSPFDVLISKERKRLADLPEKARIGTGSPRRKMYLLNLRPDLQIVDIRGNIETRFRKLKYLDGIVVAHSALIRLNLEDQITEVLEMLPAPGQGALAIEVRRDDRKTKDIVSSINHKDSFYSVMAERSFLSELGVGCKSGVSALGKVEGDRLILKGSIFINREKIEAEVFGRIEDAEEIGRHLAEKIVDEKKWLEYNKK
jgi:hydroxymethylbilane synthase